MPKQKILLLTLEFPSWPDAARFSYEANFGLEEGLLALGVDCVTIPLMYGNSDTQWSRWYDIVRVQLQGKSFDQVWFEVTHSRFLKVFLEFLDSLAPVRVGFLFESMENTPEGIAWNPAAAKARNDNLAANLRHVTHLVACDEADQDRFNREGKIPAFWWASGPIPKRLMAPEPKAATNAIAEFHGTLYGERKNWIEHPALAGLLTYGKSLEANTQYPEQWNRLSGKLHTALIDGEPITETIFHSYIDFIRTARRETYPLWLKSLVSGSAVVCLPSYIFAYPSRVPQGMAAGRPVVAFEIPNRPRIRTLYENGKEILLYNNPEELAEHLRQIQREPKFGQMLARNALAKMRRYHTEEKFVADIIKWIDDGVEPDYGDGVGARSSFADARWLAPTDLVAAQRAESTVKSPELPTAEPFLPTDSADKKKITFKTAKSGGADGPLDPELMADFAARFQLSVFIETGTYMGDTSAAAVPFFDEVHTIELSSELAQKAAQRFAGTGKVHVHQGDSADRLGEILSQSKGAPFIWLDGHYSEGVTARGRENTPVIDELKSIDRSAISNAVILIDDLRMFDARITKPGDPPSLAGYPSLQELHRLVLSMQQNYQMYVYGDVALILPASAQMDVSPLVQAMTISRLYDGVNLPLEEVVAADEVIVAAGGAERDALRQLAASRSVRINEQYAQGLHYRYWDGLATLREDAAAAEKLFVTAVQLGLTHGPVKWFLAHACVALGKFTEAEKILGELLMSSPAFAPAVTLLDQMRAAHGTRATEARTAPVAPPEKTKAQSVTAAPKASALPLDDILDFNQRSRDRWVQAKAATVPAGSKVLDMGAGTCLYRPFFAHCDYKTHDFKQYTGSEKHGGTSAYGKIDYVSEILAIPAPDHSFDVILCTEVLEHVPEPIKVLQEISRLLRPGGRAFITAPLGSGLHQLPFHFYGGYTPEWYKRFSREAGMEAVEITPNGGFFKHLAQECARAANIYGQHPELHGPGAAELHKMLLEHLPRMFFGFDAKVFDERFTVGYFVEAVKDQESKKTSNSSDTKAISQTAASPPKGSPSVVVKLQGGMGNQMFQYAAGLALARRTESKLKLDLSFLLDRTFRPNFVFRDYDLDLFELAGDCEVLKDATQVARGLQVVKEKYFQYDPQFESLNANTYLDGYWQSPRYFEKVAGEVRQAFTKFRTPLTPVQQVMADRIRAGNAVCVNVRRADFVSNPSAVACHGTCHEAYFQHAARVILSRVPDAHFFIFSDDIEWCRQANLLDGALCTLIGHDYAGDRFGAYLQLMSACRHFILPNSSFGWWAAFLSIANDKIVIAPEPWFNTTTLDSSDLLPRDWIRLCRNPGPVLAHLEAAPKVSVVMPCYKQAHYLSEAMESVVAQTFPDWELIVVNDGSPDDTSRVTREIIALHPERRIRLLEKANGGLADARNAGIRVARGKYILPLDSDDKVHPEMLQKTVSLLEKNPEIAIAYTDLVRFGVSSNVLQATEYDFSRLPLQNQLNCCSLFRREAWTAAGGYNPNMSLGYEDWDFWVGCGEKGFFGKRIPAPLFFYRVKDSSMYTKAREHHRELHAQLVLNHPALFNEATRSEAAQILAAVRPQENPAILSSFSKGAPGLVSVVIPCYKQAQYLVESVESVVGQSYLNWEIIIVNDGSPDSTTQVAQDLIRKNPAYKIRLIEKENGGLADARNAGIRFARGEYILPLDADDKIHPEFLAKTVSLLDQSPKIAIAYTDWVYFGAHTATRNAIDYDFARLTTKENLFTCTSLYRKKAWEAAGGYNTNMTRGVEDWDFWIGCGERGYVGKRIPEPLFYYRAKSGSMIHTLQPDLPAMFARIILNHPGLYNPEIIKTAQKMFEAAKLAPPKPSAPGVEWIVPNTDFVEFQRAMDQAEGFIRAKQTGEAIAAVEYAVRIAPNADCRTRASEILELLQTSGPATPVSPDVGEVFGDELFSDEEVQAVEQLITSYSNTPEDNAVFGRLYELQQGLMSFLVTAQIGKLEAQFKGNFGRVFRALVKSDFFSDSRTGTAWEQLAVLDESLANPDALTPEGSFDYRPLFARMLCGPAHRGTFTVALGRIPAWFLNDYLAYALHAPQVFVAEGEAEQYQRYLLSLVRSISERIGAAPKEKLTLDVASFFAFRANFIPLYFANSNTRELAEKRAKIMEFVLAKNGAVIDFTPSKRGKNQKKIKIGYLSAHFGAQTETYVTLPTLQLDRSKFEICLFAVEANPSPIEDRCRGFSDTFTRLPKQTHEQVAMIRTAKLDVLIIGTNVTAVTNQVSLLALHRLAPVQLVSYCSPVSTGMRHVDGYLTGSHMDFPGIHEHFSEKLMFCEGPPGCLDYTIETKGSGTRFTREDLGLAADDVVFINAAACFKILPEMQETWAKLLKAVPKSRLLLLPFNPNWSNAFPVKQFERTLTEACARQGLVRESFILANSLPSRTDVKELEKLADVYLDTFPFSGSISVIDPLELGIPAVVWEGKTPRSRMAAALLREIDIPELIVSDEPSYIQLSVRLATDRAYRGQIRERIGAAMARKPRFIDPQSYANGLGKLLESLVKH